MSGKVNKLIIQESRNDYGKEAAEVVKALSQGDEEFDGAGNKFDEARAKENVFDALRAEESAARARLQRAGNMAGYVTGTVKEHKDEEEEENAEWNHKQPARNPVGGSHG